MTDVKALILTGYGLNCDYETQYSLELAGADAYRMHMNEFIMGERIGSRAALQDYRILVFGGGFSWADDHGAGVIMASKLKRHLGEEINRFIADGNLIIGICNGFQALVNLGLLPGFDPHHTERQLAVTYNDCGNFVDVWVNLKINPTSPCIFTTGIETLELPIRHGEGKFIASDSVIDRLLANNQVVLYYADETGEPARGSWPANPNGSLRDIAGVCDPSGRVFGMMPHPEAFNHFTNHPDWTFKKEALRRRGNGRIPEEGDGIQIFKNAVDYARRI
jgi:phosphoribosylformylglycinamidine synthase